VKGGEPVHPRASEGGESDVGGDDEEEEEWHVDGGEELVGGEGGNGLAEADVEELEHACHEEYIASSEACGEAGAPVLIQILARAAV
jgi:hypothetical protein